MQTPLGKPILIIKMIPFYKDFNFCNGTTLGEFARRFKDPFLREIFPSILWEKDYPLLSLVVTLASLHAGDGGFPQGGSLEFAKALDNFWLSGMWVQPPGGVPTGAMTSRQIIQMICRKDKKRFRTSIPTTEGS